MKHFYQLTLALLAALASSTAASAYSHYVDGIYYNILSEQDKTCSVAPKEMNKGTAVYKGDMVIPGHVKLGTATYTVSKIDIDAFYECKELTSIVIPNTVTEIAVLAFAYCESLTTVTMSSSVTLIDGLAFVNCKSLLAIDLPNTLKEIGKGAFQGCTSLKSAEIPSSMSIIDNGVFDDCKSLESIVIPNTITTIGLGTFAGCYALESITLPSSVKLLDERAFDGCKNLKTIISFNPAPPTAYASTFLKVNKETCVLKVPYEAVEAYRSAAYWNEFANIEGCDPAGISQPAADAAGQRDKAYSLQGIPADRHHKGIIIRNGKKILKK